MSVSDDGSGFSKPERDHDGMGLRMMNYRAGIIGGRLAVRKKKEGGTQVVCTVKAPDAPA
jgi:signal transduction histidine kinase